MRCCPARIGLKTSVRRTPKPRKEIILDTLTLLAKKWPKVDSLKGQVAAYIHASEGMDGRRLRKAITAAAAISIETAKDRNKLKPEHVIETLKRAAGQPDIHEAAA